MKRFRTHGLLSIFIPLGALATTVPFSTALEPIASAAGPVPTDTAIAYILIAPETQCDIHPTGQTIPSGVVVSDAQGVARFYAPSASWGTKLTVDCASAGGMATHSVDLQDASTFQRPTAAQPSPAPKVRQPLAGDPTKYTRQWLLTNEYPPRPDPTGSPAAYAAWLRAVSQPTTIPPRQPVARLDEFYDSFTINNNLNWAGAAIQAGANTDYVGIYAYFVVPPTYIMGGDTSGKSSIWVGLDGQGTGSSDIIQTGILANYNQHYSPWIEYFPNNSLAMAAPTLHFNDELLVEAWSATDSTCSSYSTTGTVGCGWIEDITTAVASGDYYTNPPNKLFNANNSAEFIVERVCTGTLAQCKSSNPPWAPLTNFNQVWMSGETEDQTGAWHDLASDPYTENIMVNSSNQTLASCQDSNGTDEEVVTFVQKQ